MRRAVVPLVLLAAAGAGWWFFARPPLASSPAPPARLLRLGLPGLGAPVRIVTDRFGVPHVRASSLSDLYFAWGFVTARDRLWQLEVTRRGARGQLWEWFGNRSLESDGGAQLFELASRASRIWERESRDAGTRKTLERFAAGMNAYIAQCRNGSRPWPEEFVRLGRRPADWRPEDSVLLLLAQGVVLDLQVPELAEAQTIREHGLRWLASRERYEDQYTFITIPDSAAVRLYGDRSHPTPRAASDGSRASSAHPMRVRGAPLIAEARRALGDWLPEAAERDRASNVFAVGARRSASGRPLLANDPHLSLRAPGPFHVIHLEVPGRVDAVGAAVPGLPAIVSGRNRACAWGITSLSADVIDVYADTLSADGRRVRWNGGWADVRTEPFGMRYRALDLLPVPLIGRSRRYTPHGPVLVYDAERGVALSARWAGRDEDVTLRRLIGLERSTRASEVAERYRSLVTPTLNVVAADTLGNVVYQVAGAVPRRGFAPGYGPLPGDGRHEWKGLIPPGDLPTWQAPPSGFVVNANNLPVGRAYAEPWPRFDWPHDRAARIAQRLAGDPSVTLADLRSVQNDAYSRGAERCVPLLLSCADSVHQTLSARERAVLDTLRAWDRLARRDRSAPTLYRGWYGALLRRSELEGVPGLVVAALDGRAPEALRAPRSLEGAGGSAEERGLLSGPRSEHEPTRTLEAPERAATAVVEALRLALAELEKRLGPDPREWRWGRAHRAHFSHALAWKDSTLEPRPVPADGDNSTPCAGRSDLPWSLTFTHGPAFRHLVDLAADSSLGVVPPGNSGDRTSGHSRDLLARWASHGYVPLHLSWDRIEALRESELVLLPRPVRTGRSRGSP